MKWPPFPWEAKEINPNQEIFARNKYREFQKFAETCGWLKVNEHVVEDDDNYKGVVYLTQHGSLVGLTLGPDWCEIETVESVQIKLQQSEGEEIVKRLANGG